MKELPKEFEGRADQKSFRFRQLQRTETTALYAKCLKSGKGSETYEVIRVRKRPAATVVRGGVSIDYEAREVFPSSEDWGTYAWTYNDLAEAKKRYYSL